MRLYHFEQACVSGAFAVLHEGLEEFFDCAFRLAEQVSVMVLDDELAQGSRPYPVPQLATRVEQLDRWLRGRGYTGCYELVVLSEAFREADAWLSPRIDCVMVSEEMFTAADLANRQRRKLGLKAFSIHVVQRRPAADGEAMSATRLFARTGRAGAGR